MSHSPEDILRRIMLGDKLAQKIARRSQMFDNAEVKPPVAGQSFDGKGRPIRWTVTRAAKLASLMHLSPKEIAEIMDLSIETAKRKYEQQRITKRVFR